MELSQKKIITCIFLWNLREESYAWVSRSCCSAGSICLPFLTLPERGVEGPSPAGRCDQPASFQAIIVTETGPLLTLSSLFNKKNPYSLSLSSNLSALQKTAVSLHFKQGENKVGQRRCWDTCGKVILGNAFSQRSVPISTTIKPDLQKHFIVEVKTWNSSPNEGIAKDLKWTRLLLLPNWLHRLVSL